MDKTNAANAGASGKRSSGGRRQTYISVNHELLGFEVISRVPSGAGSGSRPAHGRSRSSGGGRSNAFSKERFFHANFRFLARDDLPNRTAFDIDPDALLDWSSIELVVVPASGEVRCPICLDVPLAPRITRCGHFFCWPCILRYASTMEATSHTGSTSSGKSNWRNCPICSESVNIKQQLKGVHFVPVTDFASNMAEISEVGIPMVLLRGSTDSAKVALVDGESGDRKPTSLDDLNPFDKVTFVSREFLLQHVINAEMEQLHTRLATLENSAVGAASGDVEEERTFVELCLSMLDDKRSQMLTEASMPSPPLESAVSPAITTSSANLFFHQSMDGQPFFLCPLSIKMLKRQFKEYFLFPPFLCAPVVEIEMFMMTEELRRRHRYLHHVPLGCQFGLCEVDLGGVLDALILDEFKGELSARKEARRLKAAREDKQAARAQRHQAAAEHNYEGGVWDDASSPGVAASVLSCNTFWEDNENFPVFSSTDEDTNNAADGDHGTASTTTTTINTKTASVPINNSKVSRKASTGLSSSFASVAATSPMAFSLSSMDAERSPAAFNLDIPIEALDHSLDATTADTPAASGTSSTSAPSSTPRSKGRKIIIASTSAKRDFQ